MNKADLKRIEKIKKSLSKRRAQKKQSVSVAEKKKQLLEEKRKQQLLKQKKQKQAKKQKEQEQEQKNKEQPKKRRWLKYIPFAMLGFSLFAKKADAQAVKTQQKAPTETVTHTTNPTTKPDTIRFNDAVSVRNEILNMAVDDLLANPDFVERAANDKQFIENITKNPELMADLIEKTGMNTLGNFDLKGFKWTAGYLKALKEGKDADILMKNLKSVRDNNKDGQSCLGAVNKATSKVGAACYVHYVYQAIPMLQANPKLAEAEGLDYSDYPFLPNGTIGTQDQNPNDKSVTGHIWLKAYINGLAEQVYGPKHRAVPSDNVRNHRDGTRYGDPHIFLFLSNIVTRGDDKDNEKRFPENDIKTENLLLALIEQKRFIAVNDMLVLLGEMDPQTLAILYIEHTNLKKQYALDQLPEETKTSENVKVTKEKSTKQINPENLYDEVGAEDIDIVENARQINKAPRDKSKPLTAKEAATWFRRNTGVRV